MHTAVRRTAATLATGITAAALLGLPTAQAEDRPASRITVRSSDTSVGSGEEFVLSGRLTTRSGKALAAGVVKVQSLSSGDWVDLKGARVTTTSEGRYRVRVILSSKGSRDLRVVGNPAGSDLRNSRARIDIQVG